MKCHNGSPCLFVEDNKLFYLSVSNVKTELTGDMNEIWRKFTNYISADEVFLDVSDRIVMEDYIREHLDSVAARKQFDLDMVDIVNTAIEDCKDKFKRLKMYVLVREDIGTGHAVNCVGHATNYAQRDWVNDDMYSRWAKYSRKKVTCKVTATQFEDFKKYEDHILVSESVLNGTEVVLIFKPREIWPEAFKRARLYS